MVGTWARDDGWHSFFLGVACFLVYMNDVLEMPFQGIHSGCKELFAEQTVVGCSSFFPKLLSFRNRKQVIWHHLKVMGFGFDLLISQKPLR